MVRFDILFCYMFEYVCYVVLSLEMLICWHAAVCIDSCLRGLLAWNLDRYFGFCAK